MGEAWPPAGAERLSDFLAGLGVPVDPAGHGVADQEWRETVELAFAGANGKNYIGTRERSRTRRSPGSG